MAADNIREIFKTDTVGEFMNKCNWNFGIISRIGGPRGLQGERGETGARGRRGAMIHTVNEPDEMMDYMDVETASEILSTLDVEETENMEDGDVVFFKNGWVCEIGIEDGEIVAREPVFPIIGPQGPQGEQGESTDSLFTNLSGNALLLNRLSLTVGNRIYLPTMDSLNGGLYFAHMTDNGNNNITIDAEKAFINFNQNTLNINSNSAINIRTSSNSQINFSINNGDIMRVENDGLKLYKKVEFMGSASIPGEIVKGGNKISLYNDKTTFNKEIIVSDGNNTTGIGPDTILSQNIILPDTGNMNTATGYSWLTPMGISFMKAPGLPHFIGCNNNGYFSITANNSSSRIKMMGAATTFQKPIIIPKNNSLKFASNSYSNNNTDETNTGNFGQMEFSIDGINILYNTNSATTPITNRIIVKSDKTTFYKPIEISAINANQPTVSSGTAYISQTAKIEYKYNQSDGSYLNIDKPVKAIVNGESVFLGVPAYTITPYPSASNTPTGWELFDDNILMTVDNNSSIYAFNVRYNGTSYRIPAVSGLNDESFASLVASEEKTFLGIGTPKLTDNVKNSTSELLELSGTIALQNVSEQSPYAFIATLGDFEDKGGKKETKPEFMKYENLMKKISANNKDMKDIFTAITDSDNTILAFAYPKPKAPTGFTYIIKTA